MSETTDLSRRTFLGGAAAIGLLAITGCGTSGSSSAKSLTFLNEETDPPTLKFIQGAIQRYKKATGATVSLSQKSIGDMNQLLASVQAGDAFDLSTAAYTDVTYLGSKLLASMDPVMDAVGGKQNFMPSSLIADSGHYYGFPYNINNIGMYYRSDRLDKVGEGVPRNWDDLKRLLSKLSAASLPGITQPISATFATTDVGAELLWSNGVEFVDTDGNVVLGESDMMTKCIQCLEFLKEIKPYFVKGMESVDYGDIVKGFITGVSSIAPYSGRVVDTIDGEAPTLADKVAFEAFPTPESTMTPASGYDVNYWLVPKQANHAGLAIDFLTWFVKNDFIGYLLTGPFNMQPPLKSIYTDKRWADAPVFHKYPEVRKTLDKMARGEGYRAGGLWVQPPVDGVLKEKMFSENVIPGMYQQVIVAGTSPKSAVQKAADQLRSIVNS